MSDREKAERSALRIIMSRTTDGIHPGTIVSADEGAEYRLAEAALDLYAKMAWCVSDPPPDSPPEKKQKRPRRSRRVRVA